MTESIIKEPRVISRARLDSTGVAIHSSIFCWHIRTLDRIASEFGCERSNEKAVTLVRGCKQTANAEVAAKLVGKRFLVDMSGRELPIALGQFNQDTLSIVENFVPDSQNEPFVQDLVGEARDATKFKLLMKAILMYGRVLYTNEQDENLTLFEVTTEASSEGLVNAMFRAGSSDSDLWCSVTEASDFNMEVQ